MRLGRRYLLPSCKLLEFFSLGRGHLPFKSAGAFSDIWKSETMALVRTVALPASGTFIDAVRGRKRPAHRRARRVSQGNLLRARSHTGLNVVWRDGAAHTLTIKVEGASGSTNNDLTFSAGTTIDPKIGVALKTPGKVTVNGTSSLGVTIQAGAFATSGAVNFG